MRAFGAGSSVRRILASPVLWFAMKLAQAGWLGCAQSVLRWAWILGGGR